MDLWSNANAEMKLLIMALVGDQKLVMKSLVGDQKLLMEGIERVT